jgi:hypothetical protein
MITLKGNKTVNSYLAALEYLHMVARQTRGLLDLLHFRIPEAYNSKIRMN